MQCVATGCLAFNTQYVQSPIPLIKKQGDLEAMCPSSETQPLCKLFTRLLLHPLDHTSSGGNLMRRQSLDLRGSRSPEE